MIVHRDLKPANLMLGGIPHETGTREMVRFAPGFPASQSTPGTLCCGTRSLSEPLITPAQL